MSNPRVSDPGGTGANMASDAERRDEMTDQALSEWVDKCLIDVKDRQAEVAEALHALASSAEHDAEFVLTMPPETFTPTYIKAVDRVVGARARLDNARADLRSVASARDLRLNRRDTEGSASRQHYIDTGNYLDAATS